MRPKVPLRRVHVATVPKLWPGGTIVCLATGPSLTREDLAYVQGKADGVVAVSNAYEWAPWADVLYSCDEKWWNWKKGAPTFTGLKFTLQKKAAERYAGVEWLQQTGPDGIELAPTGLRTGKNSGYQAINLAVHLGAARILLLGYDMRGDAARGDHCFGHHPDNSKPPFQVCIPKFKTMLAPLKAIGVQVINCSRITKIDAFPRMPLEQALPPIVELSQRSA